MTLAVVDFAVDVILVALLAIDIVENPRRKLSARLQRVEEFLRFSARKP